MPLTIADMDRTCKYCDQTLRAHCTEAEGAFYYTPCEPIMLSQVPLFAAQCQDGVCSNCGGSVASHFRVGVPSFGISFGKKTTSIQPAGTIVVREVMGFTDCRTS